MLVAEWYNLPCGCSTSSAASIVSARCSEHLTWLRDIIGDIGYENFMESVRNSRGAQYGPIGRPLPFKDSYLDLTTGTLRVVDIGERG